MGTLYPVMCKEVVPGDSFSIDCAFGLKFMPLVFPVQSKMTAYLHFFYVRNKNLWPNFQNWISGLEDHVHPYIKQPQSFFKTGTLADYLDVPTSVVRDYSVYVAYTDVGRHGTVYSDGSTFFNTNGSVFNFSDERIRGMYYGYDNGSTHNLMELGFSRNGGTPVQDSTLFPLLFSSSLRFPYLYRMLDNFDVRRAPDGLITFYVPQYGGYVFHGLNAIPLFAADYYSSSAASVSVKDCWDLVLVRHPRGQNFMIEDAAEVVAVADHLSLSADNELTFSWSNVSVGDLDLETYSYRYCLVFNTWRFIDGQGNVNVWDKNNNKYSFESLQFPNSILFSNSDAGVSDTSTVGSPFAFDGEDIPLRLSALPFRAYESIYNAYYRNTQNQPFYVDVNGVMTPQYNRYNTCLEDGADETDYKLFSRNYEMDCFTSCLPSPQQGVAPLVGMSALGQITIQDENGITTGQCVLADDNETIAKIVLTSPAASVEHARTVLNIASSGFSINDFRNTNAFQRWLETNLRKGYKYRDFIAGHFGKEPEYRELDMPEFIGGTSQQVTVSQVTNMADTESLSGSDSGRLGSFVGSANCFGGTRHTVRHYCDDYGFIVGIMCVVPTPAYSQMLPKQFLKSDKLDYYFPEFSQLGMQPITYKEVTPVQSWLDGASLSDTFGYQRPNYDLVGYLDQVHGEFRTTLKDFLIHRMFSVRPELSDDFLKISPVETNHIFSYSNPADDNILGQVVLKVSAKRPVPRVTIPSLGR